MKNQSKPPLVSVVMPTYNRASIVLRAVKSVQNQTFKGWEMIVLDDASTDETPQALAAVSAVDPRIRIIRHAKNNYPDISKTLNEGMRAAHGKYVARLDDDDWWHDSRKLEKQVAFMEAHPEYTVTGGGVIVVDADGKELFRYLKAETDEAIRKGALFANPFSHTTTMFRRAEAIAAGGYGSWRYAEDWDLWLALGERGKLYNFPEYFTFYVLAGQNKSFVHQRPQAKMILQIIRRHRKTYPRFALAYLLNGIQFLYSYLPFFLRRALHAPLSFLKRSWFSG